MYIFFYFYFDRNSSSVLFTSVGLGGWMLYTQQGSVTSREMKYHTRHPKYERRFGLHRPRIKIHMALEIYKKKIVVYRVAPHPETHFDSWISGVVGKGGGRLVPFGQIHFPHISSSYHMWSINLYCRPRERTTTDYDAPAGNSCCICHGSFFFLFCFFFFFSFWLAVGDRYAPSTPFTARKRRES